MTVSFLFGSNCQVVSWVHFCLLITVYLHMIVPGLHGFKFCTWKSDIFLFLEIHWKFSSHQKAESNWNTTLHECGFLLFPFPTGTIIFNKRISKLKKKWKVLILIINFSIWSCIHNQDKSHTFSCILFTSGACSRSRSLSCSLTHIHTHAHTCTCNLKPCSFNSQTMKTFAHVSAPLLALQPSQPLLPKGHY